MRIDWRIENWNSDNSYDVRAMVMVHRVAAGEDVETTLRRVFPSSKDAADKALAWVRETSARMEGT